MNTREAKKLKVGDRIILWAGKPSACTGTVIQTGYNAVKTKWDDGQIGIIHIDDHDDVERYTGNLNTQIVPAKATA
jgi:hypothetical protein